MATLIPLVPSQNQSVTCTLPIDNKNVTLSFQFTYNAEGEYWFMSISDKDGNLLLSGVPLVTGDYPAANVLEQYSYLNIGSAVVVPASTSLVGVPGFDDWGSNYYLAWSDTQ